MALIQLFGPSGVGKSTVMRAAGELRANPKLWLSPGEVKAMLPERPHSGLVRRSMDEAVPKGFIEHCIESTLASDMVSSQRLTAYGILQATCVTELLVRQIKQSVPIVYDEMLLHRANSLFPMVHDPVKAATRYYEMAPLPDAAVLFRAKAETIAARAAERGSINCYYKLEGERYVWAAENILRVADVAEVVLRRRGLRLETINTEEPAAVNAATLNAFFSSFADVPAPH